MRSTPSTGISPWLLGLVVLFFSSVLFAQVCATPGLVGPGPGLTGVLNSYYPGNGATVAVGATSIPVGAIDTTSGGSSTAIGTGDLLIIIQMQGAQISTSNSDCYGDGVGTAGCATRTNTVASFAGGNLTTNYLAGNWEYCMATGPVAAGSVPVRCATGAGTQYAYQASAQSGTVGAYRYQVVRVPQYSVATVTGVLTAASWNGATGGVLATQVAGTLTLSGGLSMNVGSQGFRGGGTTWDGTNGTPQLDTANGTRYYVAPIGTVAAGNATTVGAQPGGEREGGIKGEGVAGTPYLIYNGTAQLLFGTDYPGGSRGRGAPGNAGGGGANQNGGGGGGGNGGQGGQGGGVWNDVSRPIPVPVTSLSPAYRDYGGNGGDGNSRVGNNLNLSVNRLIMGGGGGGGHADGTGTNCQLGSYGGNGGGIVIIKAGQISGPGLIAANGGAGVVPNFTSGACTDAAGGGGAGGSIYVAVDAGGLAAVNVIAIGGVGGNSSYADHGPGGGGGGGVIYYTTPGAAPGALLVTGGANGVDNNNAANPAIDPSTPYAWFSTTASGSALAVAGVPTVTAPSSACLPILTVTKTTITPLRVLPTQTTAQYVINVANATGATVAAASGVAFTDVLPSPFTNTSTVATVSSVSVAGPSPSTATGTSTITIGTAGGSTANSFIVLPGGNATLTFNVAINSAASGTYQNPASVSFSDPFRSASATVVSPGGTYANTGTVGGGNYASGSSIGEDVKILYAANLTISKSNGVNSLVAGQTASYTITVANLGPSAAAGTVLTDPQVGGLNCTSVSCTSTAANMCPATPTIGALQNSSVGLQISPTFVANSTATFVVTCGITATGQ